MTLIGAADQTVTEISAMIRDAHERSNLLHLPELSQRDDSTLNMEHVEILREFGCSYEAREALALLNPETEGVAVLAARSRRGVRPYASPVRCRGNS